MQQRWHRGGCYLSSRSKPHDARGPTEGWCGGDNVHMSLHRLHTDRSTSWRSDGSSSCLDESAPQWVPAGYPRHIGAVTTGARGWLTHGTNSSSHHMDSQVLLKNISLLFPSSLYFVFL